MSTSLHKLHEQIDLRTNSIRSTRPDWPCSKGCDLCCRQLAAVPQLSATEWTLLQQGLQQLPADQLAIIRQRVAALTENAQAPIICPLLDQASGACPVYAQRPVACRSYGFYVQRALGLYCADIEQQVASGKLADVVWGNHDGIEHVLLAEGESRSLVAWFAHWQPLPPA